jgi:tetratricopeptide (TPR) repeat protein
MESMDKKAGYLPIVGGLLILLLSLALYLHTHEFGLVYDDQHIIVYNSSIHALSDNPSGFFNLFTQKFWQGASSDIPGIGSIFQPGGQALYRPVMLSALGIIYYLFELNPAAYHMLNIVINALVCLLVFITIKKLFDSWRLAFFCGILFACHPIHTEAVCYVTGLGEVLSMLFFVAALLFYVKASYREDGFRILSYILSLLFYLVGLFTKEHVICLIGILVLYDFIQYLQGNRPYGLVARLAMYGGYLVVICCNLAARYNAIGSLTPAYQNPIDNVIAAAGTYSVQLWTALKVLSKGIWLTILPLKQSPDYSFAAIRLSDKLDAPVIAAILFISLLLVVGFLSLKRRSVIAFAIFWHFITIFLVSNIILVVGTILGERLLYMPSLAAALAIAFLLDRLFVLGADKASGKRGAGAYIASALFVALAVVASMKTYEETEKWENAEYLFQAAAEVVPDSSRVHYQLGQIYMANKIYQEAESEFLKVKQIDPSFIYVYLSLGDLYALQGQYEKALKTLESMRMRVESSRKGELGAQVSKRLADLYSMMQQGEMAVEELIKLKETENTPALNIRIGEIYVQQGAFDKAVDCFKEAWDLDPENLNAAYKLLGTYSISDQKEKEMELLEVLEQKDTQSNRALMYRASLFMREFEPQKALEILDRAIERASEDPAPYAMKANILRTEFRLEEALEALDKTITLSPPQGQMGALMQKLEIYKEMGDLEKAEATADRLKQLPLTPEVKASLGDLYLKMNRFQEAVQYLREAIAGGMKIPPNFVNLGKALSQQDKNEDIVTFLTPAVEELQIKDRELYRILGGALISVKQYQKGVDLLKETIDNWGPNPWIKFQIAQGQLELKNYEETTALLDELLGKVKFRQLLPLLYHLRARVFLEDEENRDLPKALEFLEKAFSGTTTDIFPDNPDGFPEFYLTLIQVQEAMGNKEEARKKLEEALEKFPDNRPLKKYAEKKEG